MPFSLPCEQWFLPAAWRNCCLQGTFSYAYWQRAAISKCFLISCLLKSILIQILQTNLNTFPWRIISQGHLIKSWSFSTLVISLSILMTFSLDWALILVVENWWWSLLGLEGLAYHQHRRESSYYSYILFPVILGTNLMRENCIKESGYDLSYVQKLTINEWGWVSYEELWRLRRRVLSVEAVGRGW